jgi:hypothetical protein
LEPLEVSVPMDNVVDFQAHREKRLSRARPVMTNHAPLPGYWPLLASAVYGPALFVPVVWVPCWTPVNAPMAAGAEDA